MGISLQAYEQMNRRLASPRQEQPSPPDPERETSVILGVDPSLRSTGYGVIRAEGKGLHLIEAGTIECKRRIRSRCLGRISEVLSEIIHRTLPDICVVEGLVFSRNAHTSLTMGEVRGACIAAASHAGLPVYEISPRKVKKAIAGHGGVRKLAVARMVELLLSLDRTPPPDEGDALALALTYRLETRSRAPHRLERI